MAIERRGRVAPWPVATAAALVALFALGSIIMIVIALIGGLIPLALVGLVLLLVSGSTALGVWQGRRGARVVASLISGIILLTGLRLLDENGPTALLLLIPSVLIVAFLTLPAQSRAWFRPPGTPD
jgi:hypothetical protein